MKGKDEMPETLSKSPLTLVLTRVEFNAELTVFSVDRSSTVDPILQSLGFPAANTVTDATLQLTPSGPKQIDGGKRRVYQDETGGLHVVVAPRFIAFYAGCVNGSIAYSGHQAFLSKFCEVITALGPLVGQIPVVKTGYRYVNQFTGDNLEHVDRLLQPSCRGVVPTEAPSGTQLLASVLRSQFSYPAADSRYPEILQVQSGQIPEGQQVDPGVPALKEKSWALDIDTSSFKPVKFAGENVRSSAAILQNRAKSFFSSIAVTPEFASSFR